MDDDDGRVFCQLEMTKEFRFLDARDVYLAHPAGETVGDIKLLPWTVGFPLRLCPSIP